MISGVILSLVLIIAAWTDWRWRLIHNSLTYPAILCGLAWNSLGSYGMEYLPFVQGAAWATPQLLGCIGLPASILGGTICFVLMLSVYMTGGAGGGDVKLATVIGVYLGIPAGLIVLMLAFIVAAGWVLCASIYRSGWRGWLGWRSPDTPAETLPLGVFCAVAFGLYLCYPAERWVQL